MEPNIRVPVAYNPYKHLFTSGDDEEFRKLFQDEVIFMPCEGYSDTERYKILRNEAVAFMAKHYNPENHTFDALIPYLAMTFFDRVICRFEIPIVFDSIENNRSLFLVSCLVMAWKLRANSFDPLGISETTAFNLSKFLADENFNFKSDEVLKMEWLVCRLLEFRMRSLIPFLFIDYFIRLLPLSPDQSSLLHHPMHQLIVKCQADICFTKYRPSVVAASAVLIVSSKMFGFMMDALEISIRSSEFLSDSESESILQCKMKMEELYKDPVKDKKSTTGDSAVGSSGMSVDEDEVRILTALDKPLNFKLEWPVEADVVGIHAVRQIIKTLCLIL